MSRDAHIFKDDSKRPLSGKGEVEHRMFSKMMKSMGITFDRMITSPFERAKATAKITRKVYKMDKRPTKSDYLADGFSVQGVITMLQDYSPDETILLVGHEPYMSTLANALLRPEMPMDIEFKKSALMSIDFYRFPERGQGTLEFFLVPRLFSALDKNIAKLVRERVQNRKVSGAKGNNRMAASGTSIKEYNPHKVKK
jgi:phosphohistidine phosphatase